MGGSGGGGGGGDADTFMEKLRVINGRNLHFSGFLLIQRNGKLCPLIKKIECE